MFPQFDHWDFDNNNFRSLAKHEWCAKRNFNREGMVLSAQRCAKPNSNREEVALST